MELLLRIVQAGDASCHASMLEPDNASLLVVLLGRPATSSWARRDAACLLRHLVSASAGNRVQLLSVGVLHTLPLVLQDPVIAADLLLLQEVVWSVMGLVDTEVSYNGQLGGSRDLVVAALVPLLKMLELPDNAHLGHLSALMARALNVVAADDLAKEQLRELGVVELLLQMARAESEEDANDAAAASGSGAAGSSSAGAHKAQQAGYGTPAPTLGACGRTPSFNRAHTKALMRASLTPWQRLMAALLLRAVLSMPRSSTQQPPLHPQQQQASAAAAARGECLAEVSLGDEPQQADAQPSLQQPIQQRAQIPSPRAAAPSPSSLHDWTLPDLAVLSLLLPVLADDSSSPDHRLCPVKEALAALKTLVCDNPASQARAVTAGMIQVLVELVATGDMELAWQAADTMGHLGSVHQPELVAQGAVEELALLLQESADVLHLLTVRKQLEDHALSGGSGAAIPAPHSAYAAPRSALRQRQHPQHKPHRASNQPRVQLVGKQRLVSCTTSTCMYSSHDPGALCDYCIPSACLKALLRLLDAPADAAAGDAAADGQQQQRQYQQPGGASSSSASSVAQRLVSSGGLYSIFLLLHHELAGVHHSKLASSLVSLLNLVLEAVPGLQDSVRKVGGLAILCAMLDSLVSHTGVTDIYQLRVQVCLALQRVIAGNSANKLLAREHGLFKPLMSLLKSASEAEGAEVLDDGEQVVVAALDVIATCLPGSRGNQDALVSLGAIKLLFNLIMAPRASPAVAASAVRAMGHLLEGSVPAQGALTGAGALPRMVELAGMAPASHVAQCVAYALCQLLHASPPSKAKVVACGALPVMLRMLAQRPPGAHTAAASQVLYLLTVGDVDMQNEVAAQGGLHTLSDLIGPLGPLAVHALWLLCCLLYGNSFVKNSARQCGLVPLLLRAMRKAGMSRPDITMAAAHSLSQLCQSNHVNQEAVAEAGGVEAIMEVMRALFGPDGIDDLSGAAAQPGVLDAVLRLLGALVEFNATNKKLVRESGCLTLVADLVLRLAGLTDLTDLRQHHLLPAVAAGCSAVARLAQDCEENQQQLSRHEDLAAALFRLLTVEDPYTALEAARALEYIAIRSDAVYDAGEDRSEFEDDAIRSIVRVLHSRGATTGGSSAAAGAGGNGSSSAFDGAGQVSSACVREAGAVLLQIVASAGEAAAAAAKAAASAATAAAAGGSGAPAAAQPQQQAQVSVEAGPSSAPLPPLAPDAALFMQPLQAGFQGAVSGPGAKSGPASPVHAGLASSSEIQRQVDSADVSTNGRLVSDHTTGLATSQLLSGGGAMSHQHWLALVGKSAAPFQAVARLIGEGPWRPLKMQLAWLLFLLAAKTQENRDLLSKLERTSVTPLAQQLQRAEEYQRSVAAAEVEAEANAASAQGLLPVSTAAHDNGQPSSSQPLALGQQQPQLQQQGQEDGMEGHAFAYQYSVYQQQQIQQEQYVHAQYAHTHAAYYQQESADGAGGSGLVLHSHAHFYRPKSPVEEDEDLAMIRQEVAMLAASTTPPKHSSTPSTAVGTGTNTPVRAVQRSIWP